MSVHCSTASLALTCERQFRRSKLSSKCFPSLAILLLLLISLSGFIKKLNHLTSPSDERCRNPKIRSEWRTLSDPDKLAYIDAVKCLHQKPSRLQRNASRLDDFPWIHQHIGYIAHDSASFFSWHRYFIQIFEDDLRSCCGYQGSLP